MVYIGIEEKSNYYSLKNENFVVNISLFGEILSWQIKDKGIAVISNKSWEDSLNVELDEPFISFVSTALVIERGFEDGNFKKIYNIRKKSLVVDCYFVTYKPQYLTYSFGLKFNKFADYFMVGKDKYKIDKPINLDAKDLLLVAEKQDIYLGCVFKEKVNLSFLPSKNLLSFVFLNEMETVSFDMFMLSYTFSLV